MLHSFSCFLLSGGADIFGEPRELGCWPSPRRLGHYTCCPGSTEPSGARSIQAVSMKQAHLVLATLKLSGMQISREHLELTACWNRYILGQKIKLRGLGRNAFLRCTFETFKPRILVIAGWAFQDQGSYPQEEVE